MRRFALRFKLKGRRNYIHGTDIYNQILKKLQTFYDVNEINVLKMKFIKICKHQCELIFGEFGDDILYPSNAVVQIFVKGTTDFINGYLKETDEIVVDRYNYYEDRISVLCSVSDTVISINGDSGYSPVEVAVAMTKELHQKMFSADHGKWMLGQLDLLRPFADEDATELSIIFKHNFKNILTKSLVVAGNEEIGYIYFSLVKR